VNHTQALAFLARHQPLPQNASPSLLARLRTALDVLDDCRDPRLIPLLLNCHAEWEELTLYDQIQQLLRRFPEHEVRPHLLMGLRGDPQRAAFYADTARYFPHSHLIAPLAHLLHSAHPYTRLVAAAALECIGGPLVRMIAEKACEAEGDEDVQEILQAIVS
jgi:hypothetical protein